MHLVDGDLTSHSVSPSLPEVEELHVIYRRWHAEQGNDPRIGRRLADLGSAAGLAVEDFRGWFQIAELPPGMRGPAILRSSTPGRASRKRNQMTHQFLGSSVVPVGRN